MKQSFALAAVAIVFAAAVVAAAPNPFSVCTAWFDGSVVRITNKPGQSGAPMPLGRVVFDPEKKTSAPAAGGMFETRFDTPVRTIFGFGYVSYQNLWGDYSNLLIDVTDLQQVKPELDKSGMFPTYPAVRYRAGGEVELFQQRTTSGVYVCAISVVVVGHRSLMISETYAISADGQEVQQGGPFASLRFEDSQEKTPANSVIYVRRNGKAFAKTGVQQKEIPVTNAHAENDVLEWYLAGKDGKPLKGGAMSFPITGASPNTVKYIVDLAFVDPGTRPPGLSQGSGWDEATSLTAMLTRWLPVSRGGMWLATGIVLCVAVWLLISAFRRLRPGASGD